MTDSRSTLVFTVDSSAYPALLSALSEIGNDTPGIEAIVGAERQVGVRSLFRRVPQSSTSVDVYGSKSMISLYRARAELAADGLR